MTATPMIRRVRACVSAAPLLALGLGAFLLAPAPATAQSPCGPTATVQRGDTYAVIARRCDTSVEALRQANPAVDPRDLKVGQTLQLAADGNRDGTAGRDPSPAGPYTVQPGDTIAGVAEALGTTVEALIAANPDIDADLIRIGEAILPPPIEPGFPGEPQPHLQVTGVLTEEGVECPALRGHDGRLYTLVGNLEGHESGDVVEVRGSEPDASICQQGTTIEVEAIREIG